MSTEDPISLAISATDQMEALYRDVYAPFYGRLRKILTSEDLPESLADTLVADLHSILMSGAIPGGTT